MKRNLAHLWLIEMFCLLAVHLSSSAQGTAFIYQGQLTDGGQPANGIYDLTFGLYPTNAGGVPVASILTNSGAAISNGLFTTALDFGPAFDGTAYWLEIGVRPTAATNGFIILWPRQALSSSPYAVHAFGAESLSGVLAPANLPANVTFNGTVTASNFTGSAAGLRGIVTNATVTTTGGLTNSVSVSNGAILIRIGDTNTLPSVASFNSITATAGVTVSSGSMAATIQQRAPGQFAFPVSSFRPLLGNSVLALDLMPKMTGSEPPVSAEGLITWIDVCDTDCISNIVSTVGTARVAISTNYVEFGSAGYYGGVAKPLWFTIGAGATPVMTLSNNTGAYLKSSTTGGVTLDGTSAPAYVLKTNGVVVGYFGAASLGNQWFDGAVPGDVALRAEAGGRLLMGIGPFTQSPALVVNNNGSISANNGFASFATNTFSSASSTGWTNNIWGVNANVCIAGTSGTYVFYNRSGPGGTNVCGTALFTNGISPNGVVIPVPVNCGIAVSDGVGVTIQAYAQ